MKPESLAEQPLFDKSIENERDLEISKSPKNTSEYPNESKNEISGKDAKLAFFDAATIASPSTTNPSSTPLTQNRDLVDFDINDEKLIDRVWVDKAKAIISSTGDDPHEQKIKVDNLQSDYLEKTIGRRIGSKRAE